MSQITKGYPHQYQ